MRVRDVMTREVDTASATDTIQQVARMMADGDYGVVPVCEGSTITGIVTDRDIAVRGVAQGCGLDTPIERIMSRDVEVVREDDRIEDVHDRMSAAQVRRLPVVNAQDELIGIVALADVARSDDEREIGDTVQEISEESSGSRAG